MTRTDLCVNKPHCACASKCLSIQKKSVPGIFEPPCISFLLVVLFTQFIVDKMKKKSHAVSRYTTKPYFTKITQLFVLPHSHRP